jgi:hypothetical protein
MPNLEEATVSQSEVILVLVWALSQRATRPLRVSEVHRYLRHAIARSPATAELINGLRRASPADIFLILDQLRAEDLLTGEGNAFSLTEAGQKRVERLLAEYGSRLNTHELDETATLVA